MSSLDFVGFCVSFFFLKFCFDQLLNFIEVIKLTTPLPLSGFVIVILPSLLKSLRAVVGENALLLREII